MISPTERGRGEETTDVIDKKEYLKRKHAYPGL